ncbi:hypothetical protein [Saccharicrinis aurantiacus]|uniref:hypothetical protein n=1 Tax=Saccharicrinis aurantiacus TaxID=1849719 RepID=UPI00094FBBD4|nr:hypothetical protein [Saccharicrinis aurantiacus]
MRKLISLAIIAVMSTSVWGQVYRNAANNRDYNHFVRTGGESVVYINQVDNVHPILRLSSGTAEANKNIKVTVENSGNVGIGTTAPDAKLHVRGGIAIQNPGLGYDIRGNANARAGIIFGSNHATNNSMFWISPDASSGNKLHIGTGVGYSDNGLVTISAYGGKVGIGTTNPTEKLSVNGTIRAKEIKVEATNWADYVFADDYALKPLCEVEAFITENSHLPDVPSAAVVENKGIELGEMNKILLQKIEELTLYVIQQQKEINELKNK